MSRLHDQYMDPDYWPRPRGIWGGPVFEEALYSNPEDYLSEDERARIEDDDEPF